MNRNRIFVGVLLVLSSSWLNAYTSSDYKLYACTAKDTAVYSINEEILFRITLTDNGAPVAGKKLVFALTGDGGLEEQGTVVTTEKPVEIKTRLPRPGFVLLNVDLRDEQKKLVSAQAAAGVEPLQIKPGTTCPADFDQFWTNQIAELRARNKDLVVSDEEIPPVGGRCPAGVKAFEIRLEDGVLNATGILAVPGDAAPNKHPLILTFNGASMIGGGLGDIYMQADAYDAIVFNMNIHDTPNNIPRSEWGNYRKYPKIGNYQFKGADNRETYLMRDVFLRIVRCIDYLKTLPEWDRKTIIARGGSLGGAQALVAAAFEPLVCLCIANAPAMSDHLGADDMHTPGWPDLLVSSRYREKSKNEAARKVMPYFDTVNFAKRVKCETSVSVGFIDPSCPPSSVYAVYNSLATENKKMYNVTLGNHGASFKEGEIGVFGYGGPRVQEVCHEARQ